MHPSSHCDRNAWPLTRQKGEMSTRHDRVKLLMEAAQRCGSALIHKEGEAEQSRPICLHAKFAASAVRREASCVLGADGFNVGWLDSRTRQDYPTVRLRMPHVSNYTNLKGHFECNGPLDNERSRSPFRKGQPLISSEIRTAL